LDFVKIYFDDFIIVSEDEKSHAAHLEEIFRILNSLDLKISPEKCQFFVKDQIVILGHIYNCNGTIQPNTKKLCKLYEDNNQRPKNLKQLQALFGTINFFRAYIVDLNRLANPIIKALKNKSMFHWSDEMEKSFKTIMELLPHSVLHLYDENFPLHLFTDASECGLGGHLSQFIDDKWRVVSFNSKAYKANELLWTIPKKEMYAIVYNLEYYQQYLLGKKFHLYCDSQICIDLLKHVSLQKNKSKFLMNWINIIIDYDFEVKHVSSIYNLLADSLSRLHSDYTNPLVYKEHWRFNSVAEVPVSIEEITFLDPSLLTVEDEKSIREMTIKCHEFSHLELVRY
jgi:hypothetical protein